MKIVFSEKCLEYREGNHPESPERVKSVYEHIKNDYDFLEPEPCSEEDILLVHTQSLLNSVKKERFFDYDTPTLPGIYKYARLSAGGAVLAAETCLKGEPSFSLMRPPGHHAGRNFLGGFCYFNNIAIAVAKLLKRVRRIAIVDFDAHHGNGTQDIFLGNKNVLYVSLHQIPLFPGTGLSSEKNCLNYPLKPGTDESEYLEIFAEALKNVEKFNPDIIAVSAGFDTYRKDPLTSINLDVSSYERIGSMIANLGKPRFAVLEGGYSREMPQCAKAFLNSMNK